MAGQDADHEDPESQRRAVGADLVREVVGKVVVFHSKADKESKTVKSEDTIRVAQSPVIVYDPHNEAIKEAIRDGEATIIDLGLTSLQTRGDSDTGTAAADSALYGRRGSAFSMRSIGQDTGAVLPPGTEVSGCVLGCRLTVVRMLCADPEAASTGWQTCPVPRPSSRAEPAPSSSQPHPSCIAATPEPPVSPTAVCFCCNAWRAATFP